jgi:hypothetical protein
LPFAPRQIQMWRFRHAIFIAEMLDK